MRGNHVLYYDSPALKWTEALPLGNGRIGAMMFGGIENEKICLNEDTIWSGYPREHSRPNAAEALEEAQKLVREGRLYEAQRLIENEFTCDYSEAYLPLGNMDIRFTDRPDKADAYRRSLDMETGIFTACYSINGCTYKEEAFVSHPDNALVVKLFSSVNGMVSFDLGLTTPLRETDKRTASIGANEASLVMKVLCPSHEIPGYVGAADPFLYEEDDNKKGMRFTAVVKTVTQGGRIERTTNTISIRGADSVTLIFCARTSFNGIDKQPYTKGLDCDLNAEADIRNASAMTYEMLKSRHTADFKPIMDRCDLFIDAERSDCDTYTALSAFNSEKGDAALYEALFNYGRYLTVSGSRPGTTAMNLQGIWNDNPVPPWSSNYTVNINTEMNYWPAESLNLSEMVMPLFDQTDKMVSTGKKTARGFYGAQGAVAHHNSDLWGLSNPVGEQREGSLVWAFWPMSLGWLCRHMYDHYLYTCDTVFLRDRALPVFTEVVRFYTDVLKNDGNGYLSFYPATSPENVFIYKDDKVSGSVNSTMQDAILREVFTEYLSTSDILGINDPLADKVRYCLERIRPFTVGLKGQLLEWTEEYEEAEPHHRHQSHLYGLHPGRQINRSTPELLEACKRSLEIRGDDGTGWSLGWKINLWARLGDGDHALKMLKMQLRLVGGSDTVYVKGGGSYPNLFDAHPPFQIDGNFGASAGIGEMLLNSNEDELILLPALPNEWQNGYIHGMRAMYAMGVDIDFAGGKLQKAVITAEKTPPKPVNVIYGDTVLGTITSPGRYEFR